MVGATPRVWGVGLRPRYAFVSTPRLRAFLVSPIFYYPVTNGPAAEPWVLAYPSVRFEVVSRSQLRFHAGAGLIAAACLNELLGDHHDHAAQHAHDHAVEAGEPMFGLWNTVLLGGALPLGTHQHLYAEASLVLAGVKTAPSTWIGGPPPFVVQVGTTWAF